MWDTMVQQLNFAQVYEARMIGRDISRYDEREPHHLTSFQMNIFERHLLSTLFYIHCSTYRGVNLDVGGV